MGSEPEVELLVRVDAGDHEEEARAPRPALHQPPNPEHHCPLVLLYHLQRITAPVWAGLEGRREEAEGYLEAEAEGEGEEGDDEEPAEDGEGEAEEPT